MSAALICIVFKIYSGLIRCLFVILFPILLLMPKTRNQLRGRWPYQERVNQSKSGRSEGAQQKFSVVFFCSSAGEFEQAVPLIERLEASGFKSLVCFFSASGPRFLKARAYDIAYVLAPLDTVGNWQRFFRIYQPAVTVIIRHELWPAFCYVAVEQSKLFVLHITKPAKPIFYKTWIKRFLLERAFFISAVDADSYQYLQKILGRKAGTPKTKLIADTKFDRLLDRQKQLRDKAESEDIKKLLAACHESVFIIGSAWQGDVTAALQGFKEYLTDTKDLSLTLCLVPHEPTPAYVSDFVAKSRAYGLSVQTLRQVLSETLPEKPSVLIVDRLGLLTDLYRHASLVMVGGAMQHKVHNVIEPAAYGVPLCFGPLYQNAPEAIELVKKGLATVVQSGSEMRDFIASGLHKMTRPRPELLEHVRSKAGAANQIVEIIKQEL